MGAHRDQQMFRELDARSYGYTNGSREATNVAFLRVGEALGVDADIVEKLTSTRIDDQLLALSAVKSVIGQRMDIVQAKWRRYNSPDPADVAGAIIDDQDPEDDQRGYTSTHDYKFMDKDGTITVQTSKYMGNYFKNIELSNEWVHGRLSYLGVDCAEDLSSEITVQIITQLSKRVGEG